MLIAYVSDERYVALPDVILEFEGDAGSFEARSRATGSVHVDLPSGTYKVTLQKPGFGAKSVRRRDRCRDAALSLPPARRTACSATPGPSGSRPAKSPSSAFTPSSPTI